LTPNVAATGTLSADDNFNVQWQNPEDADLCWVWDPGHFPFPFMPLAIDSGGMGAAAIAKSQGVPKQKPRLSRFINGYWYIGQTPGTGPGTFQAEPSEERKKQIAEQAKDPWATWKNVWEPEIRSLLDPIKSNELQSIPFAGIADELERLLADSASGWGVTMAAAQVLGAVSGPFIQFCVTHLGAEGELLASTMLSGYSNYSTQSEVAIWELARLLGKTPDPERAIAELERNPESTDTEPGKLANRFLNHHGWRSSLWSDMATPVWRIDPTPLFELLRNYIDKLPEDPRVATRRAAQRRRRLVDIVRRDLGGEELQHFDELLETASIYVRLREARAFWQVVALGVLGVPCRAAGARLVEAGVIKAVEDIYYLHLDDIREATSEPASDKWMKLVAERKSAYVKYQSAVPPLTVGAPYEGDLQELHERRGKFKSADSRDPSDADDHIIYGTAASRGTVRGTARIIYSLNEAERLKEGEILICRTSSPPWTPLIARSAGVIAETGGVLMHCAIVTREYAIPCVVGVGPIGDRIKDGETITIDGAQGIIRVE